MKLAVLSFLAALALSSCHVILEPMVVRTYAVPVYTQSVYVRPVHVHHVYHCPPPRPIHHCCK